MSITKRIKSIMTCMLFLMSIFCYQIPSSATYDGTISRRALIATGPMDDFNTWATMSCINSMFRRQYIYDTFSYTEPLNTTNNNSFLGHISNVFEDADDDDVSYLYINAHGDNDGNLYIHGKNAEIYMTMQELRTRLDTINGHIVVFINSCYAGAAINRGLDEDESKQISIDQAILNSFLSCGEGNSKSGELDDNTKYTVFCSSLSTQKSWAQTLNGCGIATMAWAYGAGFEVTNVYTGAGQDCDWYADISQNGIITAEEYNDFTVDWINEYNNIHFSNSPEHTMTACYYSASPYFTIFTRNKLLGDIDQDNQIDLADVLLLNKHIANVSLLTGYSFVLADIDSSGTLNNVDVLRLRYLCTLY